MTVKISIICQLNKELRWNEACCLSKLLSFWSECRHVSKATCEMFRNFKCLRGNWLVSDFELKPAAQRDKKVLITVSAISKPTGITTLTACLHGLTHIEPGQKRNQLHVNPVDETQSYSKMALCINTMNDKKRGYKISSVGKVCQFTIHFTHPQFLFTPVAYFKQ